MSDHKKPMSLELRVALETHRLPTDKPSQLADSFRHGWYAGHAAAQQEIARLRAALEDALACGVRGTVRPEADLWSALREALNK